jgi:hypothetical protein
VNTDIVKVDTRPVDLATGKPIGPLAQPGYYPGFSTLDQQKFWDAKTREIILERVNNIPEIRFFEPEEARLLTAICARIIPQDDRDEAHIIPIVPQIDDRLYENSHDGYQYENMPPDREAFQLGIKAIEQMAMYQHGRSFLEIGPLEQDAILRSLHQGEPAAAHEIWAQLPVHRFWTLLLTDCAEAYYSHPFAWDEIGFGGPAYPRAYMRLERGEAEPWEVDEKRYEWAAPANSLSGEHAPIGGQTEHYGSPGQGGTH